MNGFSCASRADAPLLWRSVRPWRPGADSTVAGRRIDPLLPQRRACQRGQVRRAQPPPVIGRFERQMRWLAAHYTVVTLRDFVDRLTTGTSMRSIAAVTFDDGYAGVFEHAVPILHALAVPATVFVVAGAVGRSAGFWWDQPEIVETGFLGRASPTVDRIAWRRRGDTRRTSRHSIEGLPPWYRPADWNTIRARTGNGIDIGVHSATHRSLPTLTDARARARDRREPRNHQQATGVSPDFFAYPYGHWNARVRDRVRSAGYVGGPDAGYRTEPESCRSMESAPGQRPGRISDAAFEAWAAGLYPRRRG